MEPLTKSISAVQPKGIPALTGIRGLASLWVVLFHVQLNAGTFFGLAFLDNLPFLRFGWHAVDLFFMLSGFILMYSHQREFHTLRVSTMIRFAKLRITRIYPLNTVVLFLIGALALLDQPFISWMRAANDPGDFSSGAFIRTLLLANRWFLREKGSWNEPVWSLSLELLGYAVFPLLAYGVLRLRKRPQATALALVSLSSFICFSYVRHMLFVNMIGQIAVVRMICCFVVGISVCRMWALTESKGEKWASGVATTGVLGIVIACLVPKGEVALNSLFAILLFALAFQHGMINSLLSSRLMMFLGRISFPLYLTHGIVFWWLRYFMHARLSVWSQAQTSLLLLTGFFACVVLSAILNLAIETPAHSLGRRWARIVPGKQPLIELPQCDDPLLVTVPVGTHNHRIGT